MKRSALILTFIVVALAQFGLASSAAAQQERTPPDGPIDATTRNQVIDTVLKRLNESYVFRKPPKRWRNRFANESRRASTIRFPARGHSARR